MKTIKIVCCLAGILLSGCSVSPFSPKNQQRINNNGKIDEIKSNQNGLMLEFMKLKQDLGILNSQLKEVQNGLVNMNNAISRNENSGIQILQGDGSLILVFSILIFGGMLWYRSKALKSEKNLDIIVKQVVKYNLAELNDEIIKCAIKEGKGKDIVGILSKAVDS